MPMPTPLPTPWPSGPVVTSTPAVRWTSGCPGVSAAPLPELLDVVEGQPVPGEEQKGVQQDRGVAVGKDEAVAVGPLGVGRVVAHDAGEEHVRQRRQRHGRARVPRVGLLGGVHGEAPDDVDPELFELRFGHDENRTRSSRGANRALTTARGRRRDRRSDPAAAPPTP